VGVGVGAGGGGGFICERVVVPTVRENEEVFPAASYARIR
jgi:hypothetical protein